MFYCLNAEDIELIVDGLNALAESREEEVKWAGDDKDLIESDQHCIEKIYGLLERLGSMGRAEVTNYRKSSP